MPARRLAALLILLALSLLVGALAHAGDGAAPDAGFTLERVVVSAGGGRAFGAGVELDATAGQPVAGLVTGPNLRLVVGFWGVLPPGYHVYLPLTLQ